VQKEIATILPARDQYIVTTSEFDSVKGRLQLIESNMKVKDSPNKPTLRKRTAQNKGGNTTPGGTTTTTGGDTTTAPDQTSDDSDRPTLKRRPDCQ
jgi:hypothetical protein